jgi:hypothetical protein
MVREERVGLADRFLNDVDQTFARIRERPFQFPSVADDVRRARYTHFHRLLTFERWTKSSSYSRYCI